MIIRINDNSANTEVRAIKIAIPSGGLHQQWHRPGVVNKLTNDTRIEIWFGRRTFCLQGTPQ